MKQKNKNDSNWIFFKEKRNNKHPFHLTTLREKTHALQFNDLVCTDDSEYR